MKEGSKVDDAPTQVISTISGTQPPEYGKIYEDFNST